MRFGTSSVERVLEWVGPLRPVSELLPETPPQLWEEQRATLTASVLEESTGRWRAAMQSWIVRLPDLLVIIDTGIGNGRQRPQAPAFDHLDTPFRERLDSLAVDPAEVDVVVNTHIHYDHVGWNTSAAASGWRPTFPNARYLIPEADHEYFRPENAAAMRPPRTEDERARFDGIREVFEDSIRPVVRSGQAELWRDRRQIHPRLTLEQTPGHTPGSSVVWLDDGPGAVFVGDLLHSPVQLLRPHDACAFDLDPAAASAARRRVLAQAADQHRWVFPAHVAGAGGFRIEADDGVYRLLDWAEFPPA